MIRAMTAESAPTTLRAAASRVAKWFVAKGRTDDAVQVLTAWAVTGPNDQEGQTLLAEALRIDPSATIAKAAFERMEGIAGRARCARGGDREVLARKSSRGLEAEIKKPSFPQGAGRASTTT